MIDNKCWGYDEAGAIMSGTSMPWKGFCDYQLGSIAMKRFLPIVSARTSKNYMKKVPIISA